MVQHVSSRSLKKLKVKLDSHSYEVWVGEGLHQYLGALPRQFRERKVFFIADENLKSQARSWIRSLRREGYSVESLFVGASEELKSLKQVESIYTWLLEKGADRSSMLWVMGGGTLGDALGFVAGTYLRGIAWVSIPTTLLAQVDSGLGGKTGLNHEHGKNLIGVFHQPLAVMCDTSFLSMLPERELYSGLGEVIKYALIFDGQFYRYLKRNWSLILNQDPGTLRHIVFQCLRWKSLQVQQDERDVLGKRALLNFGHTLGHVLENLGGYSRYRHGEAVVWGMKASVYLSFRQNLLTLQEYTQILQFLSKVPVPSIPKTFSQAQALSTLRLDKKAVAGEVRFVLLRGLGKGISGQNVSQEHVKEVWSWLKKQ